MKRQRLTEIEFLLLTILASGGPSYPYRLGQEIEDRGGKGEASLGALYKALHRMESAGYVIGEWEQIDPHKTKRPRRRLYTITGAGVTALSKAAEVRKALLQPALESGL